MWDLTVPGGNDHDFFVATGAGSHSDDTAPVLAHNEDAGCEPRFVGQVNGPPTDELPDLNTKTRFVGSEDGSLPIDLASQLDLADGSGQPNVGFPGGVYEPGALGETAGNSSDLAGSIISGVDRGEEILHQQAHGGVAVPTGPVDVPGAPPVGGVAPAGASALVTAAFAVGVFVAWLRQFGRG
jgi:hypothetical protein